MHAEWPAHKVWLLATLCLCMLILYFTQRMYKVAMQIIMLPSCLMSLSRWNCLVFIILKMTGAKASWPRTESLNIWYAGYIEQAQLTYTYTHAILFVYLLFAGSHSTLVRTSATGSHYCIRQRTYVANE